MEVREFEIVDKVWGREEHIIDSKEKGFCGKLLKLKKGFRCSVHRHPKDETFFILNGRVLLELENESGEMDTKILTSGNIVDIFDKKWHRFSGLEDSTIIEFSTPDCESERKIDSGEVPDFENWKEKVENDR